MSSTGRDSKVNMVVVDAEVGALLTTLASFYPHLSGDQGWVPVDVPSVHSLQSSLLELGSWTY